MSFSLPSLLFANMVLEKENVPDPRKKQLAMAGAFLGSPLWSTLFVQQQARSERPADPTTPLLTLAVPLQTINLQGTPSKTGQTTAPPVIVIGGGGTTPAGNTGTGSSTTPGKALLPDVVGQNLAPARQSLEARKFVVDVEYVWDGGRDEVLSQFPRPTPEQVVWPVGTRVLLSISKRAVANPVKVPNLIDKPFEEAQRLLAPFTAIWSVEKNPADQLHDGKVIAQDPPHDTELEAADPVRVKLSITDWAEALKKGWIV